MPSAKWHQFYFGLNMFTFPHSEMTYIHHRAVELLSLAPRLVPGPVARFAALVANLGPAPATILARGPYSPACETPAANAFHVAFYDAVQMMSLVTSTLQIMRRIMKSICQNLRQCRLMIASCNRLKSVLTKTSANSTIPVRGTFFFLLNFC